MTTGVLLQQLVNAKNMNMYTHIILDEVHERDQEMDFLLLIVKKFYRQQSQTRLILMSATIDTEQFSKYVFEILQFMCKTRILPKKFVK